MALTAKQTFNPAILQAEYAVRGRILIESERVQQELQETPGKYPFDKLIPCNIGNPQELLQKPITFNRQVLALVDCPTLLDNPAVVASLPTDVVQRARDALRHIGHPHKTGAYSHSKGHHFIRETVCDFLLRRDGIPANPEHIYLTDGASAGVKAVLSCYIRQPSCAFMIPVPQYPLYSATLTMMHAQAAPYYLTEEKGWALEPEELERSYQQATEAGNFVKGIVVINPGNPTGQVMSEESLLGVCRFAKKHGLVVLADEVYQTNIYKKDPATGKLADFVSMKKVVGTHADVADVPLVSFHSTSKGVLGECGRRGGYMECHNLPQVALDILTKLASVNLCANVGGQLMVDLMLKNPQPGDASYASWKSETDALYLSLQRRATRLADGLNAVPGINSQPIAGSMYAFPSLTMTKKAEKVAAEKGVACDAMWAMELMLNTGVIVVPGSGFGQRPGTWHVRITILPPEDQVGDVIKKVADHHRDFCRRYADDAKL